MQLVHEIAQLRSALNAARGKGLRIGLVPTMGALHEGHLALIREARAFCDVVVVSIFVNPTQFGPNEDIDRYPRTLEADARLCKNEGVDFIFAPSADEMYPGGSFLRIEVRELADTLCGATRPGHFNGVLQVVNKLFQIIQPHDAYFGQKDIQQYILIRTMVNEFNIPVDLHPVPTVREPDGLALSSRNRYLNESDRAIAPHLQQSLREIQSELTRLLHADADPNTAQNMEFNRGPDRYTKTVQQLRDVILLQKDRLTAIGFKIDYLEVVDFKTLQPVNTLSGVEKLIIAGAVYLGKTRLIDNIIVENN